MHINQPALIMFIYLFKFVVLCLHELNLMCIPKNGWFIVSGPCADFIRNIFGGLNSLVIIMQLVFLNHSRCKN